MPEAVHCYDYPRPAITVDALVLAHQQGDLVALLVRRGRPPFAGSWAIPGGFLDADEEIEAAVLRELREETGLILQGKLHFLGVFGRPDRDPRERTISLAHVAYLSGVPPEVAGGDDAAAAEWRPADANDPATPLAFDHDEILRKALDWFSGFNGVTQADLISS